MALFAIANAVYAIVFALRGKVAVDLRQVQQVRLALRGNAYSLLRRARSASPLAVGMNYTAPVHYSDNSKLD